MPEPFTLRQHANPRELAMNLLAASEAYWHGGISGNELIAARAALWQALDAQEATLAQLQRDAALGANVRAIVTSSAHLEIEEYSNGWQADVIHEPSLSRARSLDEAVASMRRQVCGAEKDGPQ